MESCIALGETLIFSGIGTEMAEKYRKVIVTKEYIVKADSDFEAKQLYKNFSVWSEQDINTYELTDNDLAKYDLTNP